jgi:hypothetical protein
VSAPAPGTPDKPIRLHLFNDTTLDNLLEYDVDEPGFVHGWTPTHILVPIHPDFYRDAS